MLSLTKTFGGIVAAAALALGLAGAAPAATLSWSALPAAAIANPIADATGGTVIQNDATDTPKVRIGPWGGAGVYTSVSKGFATYNFDNVVKSLSFVWATPDGFNGLEFYLGGMLVDTVAGFGVGFPLALPTVKITDIGTMGFDSVNFTSTGTAFEFSNLSVAAIPVPAAGLLLVSALGGIALLRRRNAA